jgi:hypothetical protein
MAYFSSSITAEQAALIRNAPLFFVATADPQFARGAHGIGPINVSPKGGVRLHMLSPNRVAFLDHKGSGNETAQHSSTGSPVTVMVCSFEERNAAIVRLYGKARVTPVADSPIGQILVKESTPHLKWPYRNVVDIEVECAATSCGYGVPVMMFLRDRRTEDRGRRYKSGDTPRPPNAA